MGSYMICPTIMTFRFPNFRKPLDKTLPMFYHIGSILVISVLVQPGLSLRCYSCDSINDKTCRNLTSQTPGSAALVMKCQEDMMCLQKVDKNQEELVVFRECSHRTFGNKCNENQDSCHYYCDTDLCNTGLKGDMPGSTTNKIAGSSYLFYLSLLYYVYFLM